MSVSILAVPYAIAWIVGGAGLASVVEVIDENMAARERERIAALTNIKVPEPCEDVHIISEVEILEKTFETPFMDKDLLLKTLKEHGATNIIENEYGQIKAKSGNYALSFERMEQDKPYSVMITYDKSVDVNEKFQDLNSEYTLNVQEAAYLDIVNNLKNNNMEIEEEEVLEDNTIVLTINLE